jgi:hypothetical protein
MISDCVSPFLCVSVVKIMNYYNITTNNMKTIILLSSIFLLLSKPTDATFLKNKEITNLEAETQALNRRIDQCESHVQSMQSTFDTSKSCSDCCDSYKVQLERLLERFNVLESKVSTLMGSSQVGTTETIENRLISLELKMMQIEQVGTPGSIQRRPAFKRGVSSNAREQRLTPNVSYQDDYFSPTSPYS